MSQEHSAPQTGIRDPQGFLHRQNRKGQRSQVGFGGERSWQRRWMETPRRAEINTQRGLVHHAWYKQAPHPAPSKPIWAVWAARDEDVSPSPASRAHSAPSGRSPQPLVLVTPRCAPAQPRCIPADLQGSRNILVLFCFVSPWPLCRASRVGKK